MQWLRKLLRPAEDPRPMRLTSDPELDAPGTLLERVESSLAELERARERVQATAHHLEAAGAGPRSLEAVQDRLEALAHEEQEMHALRARLLCEQVDEAVERAQMRAEAVKARASVLLGTEEDDDLEGTIASAAADDPSLGPA